MLENLDMRTEWFCNYYLAMKKRARFLKSLTYENGVVCMQWMPEIEDACFNTTFVDRKLCESELDFVIEKVKDYKTGILTSDKTLAERFSDKVSLKFIEAVWKIKVEKEIVFNKNLRLQKVKTIEEFVIWAATASKVFDEYSSDFIFNSYKDDFSSEYCGYYIGYEDNKPVCVTQIMAGKKEVAGVFWVGTVKEARKKGYGKEIVFFAINDFVKKGYKEYILIPEDGVSYFYKSLGFYKDMDLYCYDIIKKDN